MKTSTNQLNKFACGTQKPCQTGVSWQGWKETHTIPHKPVHVETQTHTHTHTHTPKSLVFVFNKVNFIIDRDLSKQFWFQVDGSEEVAE